MPPIRNSLHLESNIRELGNPIRPNDEFPVGQPQCGVDFEWRIPDPFVIARLDGDSRQSYIDSNLTPLSQPPMHTYSTAEAQMQPVMTVDPPTLSGYCQVDIASRPSALTENTRARGRGRQIRNQQHIPRPRNAFIVFRSHYIEQLKACKAPTLSTFHQQSNLSKLAANVWNLMDENERKPYSEEATKERECYEATYPDFVQRSQIKGKLEKRKGKRRAKEPPTGSSSAMDEHASNDILDLQNVHGAQLSTPVTDARYHHNILHDREAKQEYITTPLNQESENLRLSTVSTTLSLIRQEIPFRQGYLDTIPDIWSAAADNSEPYPTSFWY